MTVSVPHKETLSAKNDIVVGRAVIPALPSRKSPITWVLPNFQYTCDKEYATRCAERINTLITQNASKRSKTSFN